MQYSVQRMYVCPRGLLVHIVSVDYLLLGLTIREFRLPMDIGTDENLCLFVVALEVRKRRPDGRRLYAALSG